MDYLLILQNSLDFMFDQKEDTKVYVYGSYTFYTFQSTDFHRYELSHTTEVQGLILPNNNVMLSLKSL